ncbi:MULTISPECIES: acyltransferase [unclassified Methylobacterium]|uniref:acyltransferase family protein n=1 Tax=unclassified Methylobacterium TaxID=2615210 RepID=UPI000ADED70E|nr:MULTISPECIES: acyltransferase [unclassified Methylobacterium]
MRDRLSPALRNRDHGGGYVAWRISPRWQWPRMPVTAGFAAVRIGGCYFAKDRDSPDAHFLEERAAVMMVAVRFPSEQSNAIAWIASNDRSYHLSGDDPMIYNVQTLRAIAAYLVVGFHCQILLFGDLKYSMGAWGVDIFFVISGFVMAYTTDGRNVSPRQFIVKRLVRVLPLYWFMTIAVFLTALSMPFLFRSVDAGPAQLLMSLAFIPFEKSSGLIQPVLFLGWTLNYEIFFYCLFCLSLYIQAELNRYLCLSLTMVALVILGAMFRPEDVPGRFYTDPIILEFVVGIWIYYIARHVAILPSLFNVPMIGTLGLASFGLLLAAEFLWPTVPRFIGLGLPAASLVLAAILLETKGAVSKTDFAIKQGNSSYALYLTHFLSYQLCEKIVFKIFDPQSLYLRLAAFVSAMALAGILAWIVHRQIEIPLTQSVRDVFTGFWRRSPARP